MNTVGRSHCLIKIVGIILILSIGILSFSACTKSHQSSKTVADFKNWDDVIGAGGNQEVTILMWGGNESINQYMDEYVAKNMTELYGITLKRVPMNAPDYLAKLINEKKSNLNNGTADLLWINAENFSTAKEAGLLAGPFTQLLPNLNQYYDLKAADLNSDSGIPIEGYEGIWGRAQLVITYDSAVVENPPKTYEELLVWVKQNPGKFTYPRLPDDFVGSAFVRNAFYELTGESEIFQHEMTEEGFQKMAQPVSAYFQELNPYLWNKGQSFPATQEQLDALFKNGEVDMTIGFEVGKTPGLVAAKVYPDTVKTYVLDTGTIGNAHYLAIPFNAPNQAAALLVVDFLESPEAQIEKMKSEVWGDMPGLDLSKLSQTQQDSLHKVEVNSGALSLKELTDKRLPEMKSDYIDRIKNLWVSEIAGK
ncbi:MAG: ABC transporter substrate-binding protein [Acetobacterium sp.]